MADLKSHQMASGENTSGLCERCGWCCVSLGGILSATREDLERWERERRQDILAKCDAPIFEGAEEVDIWLDKDGEIAHICPWLRKDKTKWKCIINDTKPEVCKKYFCRGADDRARGIFREKSHGKPKRELHWIAQEAVNLASGNEKK